MTINDVSIRALLAVVSLGSAGYLWAVGEPVSDEHLAIVAMINGFYFGSRTTETVTNIPRAQPRADLERADLLAQARDRLDPRA